MSDNDRKEHLSIAWLKAFSSAAGFAIDLPSPDRDSIDVTPSANGPYQPKLDIQLKATSSPQFSSNGLRFRLSKKNYIDLIAENRLTPLILVVLELPPRDLDWITIDDHETTLRKRAWWQSLRGASPIQTNSITVRIPSAHTLNMESLIDLMQRSAESTL